jgi:hypothetical protein
MASASFTLRAVDATKAAFASVQNSLTRMQSTLVKVSAGAAGFFGFAAAIGGIRRLDAFLTDAEKNAKKLGLSSQDLDKLTIATDAADRAAMKLQKTTALAAASAAGLFTGADVAARAAEIRYGRVIDELEKLHEQIGLIVAETDALSDTPAAKFAAMGDAVAKLNKEIADSNQSVDAVENAQRRLNIARIEKDQISMALSARNEMNDAISASKKAEDEYLFSLISEVQQQKHLNAELEKNSNQIEFIKKQMGATFEALDVTQATPRDISLATEMIELLKQRAELTSKIKVLETDLQIIAKDAGAMIAQGFEDAIISGQKLGEVVRSLGRDLLRLVFNQMVTQPLASGISGFIQAALTPRAMGGPVSSGSSYVVGEEGPELFVPHASGTIVPNNKIGSGGGGAGGVTINYNIASGVSRAELVPILDQERRRLKAEIPDMVRRGGAYRAAFA